jgi:hypothetical protein
MSDYKVMQDGERSSIVLERLTLKGKAIMELCLERRKNLCMKGFIDCQIEKGGIYTEVVVAMIAHIDNELARTEEKELRALLLDLRTYALEELRLVGSEASVSQE